MFGDLSEVVPLLPIPNRIVKRLSADDSVDYPCESRTSPNFLFAAPDTTYRGLCFDGNRKFLTNKIPKHIKKYN